MNVMQAWIALRADDPEAVSAREVARARLAAGRTLERLERFRLVEVTGSARPRAEIERLLHASTQFYNPHKERCTLRAESREPLPCPPESKLVLVWERGGERRAAAELWWRHETGETVEVREGVVWAMRFAPAAAGRERPGDWARDLADLTGVRHGLLCNRWSQESRIGMADTPPPWIRVALPALQAGIAGGAR